MSLLAKLNFPPIGELIDWKSFGPLGFNKTALIDLIAAIGTLSLFFYAARKKSLVPRGVQNLVESVIDFVTDQIIMQTIGPDGMVFLPFLTALFCFIFIGNIFEVVPLFQFPAVRPFSLAIRLFANMMAGHLLLVTFALLTDALLFHNTIVFLKPIFVLPAAMGVVMTGFEVLIAILQAFIFTILTAVYIGLSMNPEH